MAHLGRLTAAAHGRTGGWKGLQRAGWRLAAELDDVVLLCSFWVADLGLALPGGPARHFDPMRALAAGIPGAHHPHIRRPVRLAPLQRRRVPVRPTPDPAQPREVWAGRLSRGSFAQAAKRGLDIAVASFALLTLAPLLLVCAAAVRLETSGPALFRQRRTGRDGRSFLIWKFRTMTVMEDGPVILQATPSDPRVTHVGRVLRRSSIDELPQLFNVLRGDMSLVGPRPHAVAHDVLYGARIARYTQRQTVKPGITGWAQVKGMRGETRRVQQMVRRVAHDVWYVNNWSLGLDVRILLMTCVTMFRNDAF